MVTTEILTGGVELIDRLSDEWTELCDEGASSDPFLRPEWFSAFVRNFENEIDLVTVRRDGKLRALLPVVKKSGSIHGIPVRKLQTVYNLNTQRFDLVHGADETEKKIIVNAVWEVIRDTTRWDVMEMRLVKKDSWFGDVLTLAESEKHKTGIWPMDGAPFITLPQSDDKVSSIDNFFKGSRKHFRQELDRRLRRLKEIGDVEFVVTQGFTTCLINTYFDLESNGWKGRSGTAVTDDPLVAQMHEEFAANVAEKQSLFVYQLKLDGKIIAMSLNIKQGPRIIHWKTSYDEKYSRYSPGNLLFRKLVQDCINDGHHEIDLLSPVTVNKKAWATSEREHVAFYIFRRSFIGYLLWNWKFHVISRLRELKSDKLVKMSDVQIEKHEVTV